jgi:hypothetical protein
MTGRFGPTPPLIKANAKSRACARSTSVSRSASETTALGKPSPSLQARTPQVAPNDTAPWLLRGFDRWRQSSGELIQKPRAPSDFLISSVRKPSASLQSVAIGHRDPKSFPGPIAVSPGPASLFLPVIEIMKNSKAAVLQGFLAFLASGSLFFSKITLILAQ